MPEMMLMTIMMSPVRRWQRRKWWWRWRWDDDYIDNFDGDDDDSDNADDDDNDISVKMTIKMRKWRRQQDNKNNDDAHDDGWRCLRWWMTMRMMMDDGWRGRWRYNNDEDDAGEPADPPAGDYLLAAERHLSQQPLRTATQGAPPIDISI